MAYVDHMLLACHLQRNCEYGTVRSYYIALHMQYSLDHIWCVYYQTRVAGGHFSGT